MDNLKLGTVEDSYQYVETPSSLPVSRVVEKPNKLSMLNWGKLDTDFIGKLIESKGYSVGVSHEYSKFYTSK